LVQVLVTAKRLGQVGRNVASDSVLPPAENKSSEKLALTSDQRNGLYAHTANTALGVLVLLCGYFALRPAEARALTWTDIGDGQISVNKQLDNSDRPTTP